MKHIQVKTTKTAVWVQVPAKTPASHIAQEYARKWKDTSVSVRDESGKILAHAVKAVPSRPENISCYGWNYINAAAAWRDELASLGALAKR